MLRFFRTLRRKLIEENNIRKYVWYALGEVLLVVIGILIALQINNWNEDRVNHSKKESYKQSLIEDLRRDTTRLSRAVKVTERLIQTFDNQSDRLSTSSANYDSLFVLVRDEFSIGQGNVANFNSNTFQILTATGDISLFDKDIVEQLYILNEMQYLALDGGSRFYQLFVEETLVFMRKYPIATFGTTVKRGPIIDDMWLNVNKEELAKDFHSLSFIKNFHLRTIQGQYPIVLQKTTEILEKLEEQN